MKRFIAAAAALVVVLGLGMAQGDDWTNTDRGSFRVERVWTEKSGDFTFGYAIVTYRNTTSKKFTAAVTMKGTFYDSSGSVIDTCERSFFCFEVGPIEPGFQDSVKLEIDCQGQRLKSVSVIIARAQ